ncbi:ABC transporter permease [Vallicoccus soli]|uniref:ABC transporter permease n=1 Tax=Vallicoccus soli TaxID=2339232 RepID=A0A3A3Z674_9ACTN|nr:ABC transporter permease [Vallicoccus soli]
MPPAGARLTGSPAPPRGSRAGRRWVPYALLLPGLAWLAVFFVAPTVQLVATSLYDPSGSLETGYRAAFAVGNYASALADYAPQLGRSFLYAGTATVLALLLAYPLAYTLAFKAGRWRGVLLVLVIAPFFTSFLLRTLAWTTVLADNGWVVDVLRALGVVPEGGRLLATPVAVVTGLTYNFLPFMVLPLYASLERLDHRLVEAAGDLYAGAWTAFRKVTFPLSLPGVVAGTLLTFIPAAGDYINAELLGTPNQYMLGNVIDSSFLVRLDYPEAAALSCVLMVSIVVLVSLYVRRAGTEELV